MRRIMKAICLALSLIMLVDIAGFEALASDASSQQNEADKVENAEANEDTKADASDEEEKDIPSADKADTAEKEVSDVPEDSLAEDDSTDVNHTELSEPVNEPAENDSAQEQEETKEELTDDVQVPLIAQEVEEPTAEPVAGADNQLKISWKAVTGAEKYQVNVLKYADSTLVKEYETTDVSLTVDVTRGEKYYIEVTSLNTDSTSLTIGKIPAVLLASPTVTTTTSSSAIRLTWKAVTGADKYRVVRGSETQDVTTTTYRVEKLTAGKKYSFSAYAICTFNENNKTYTYISDATNVSATTKNIKPAKVATLTAIDGDKSAILTWSKTTRATSYSVYRYNATKKKWEVIKTGVTKLTYTDTKLTQGKTYKYRVAAVNDGGTGTLSSTVSVSVKKTPAKIRSIGYKAVIKSRAPLFTSKTSKKVVRYLKVGTKVTTIDYYKNGRYQINLGGKTYWLSAIRLRFTSSVWTTSDYSTKVKQDFVNSKGYSSKSKYLIWVSQYTQRVIIYQGSKGKWKVLRSGQCATGLHSSMTPKGVFKIISKSKGIFYKYTYEKPVVYFKKGIAFHSRIKRYSGGYSDATIGRPKSHGCVRLMDTDINYIYKYCPIGTTVVSY